MHKVPELIKGFILAVMCLQFDISLSQQPAAPNIQNPNAASLGIFGEHPINMFTGAPNISIPIHTMRYGKIEVPITLRYHPSSVKPATQPGWVGLGWNLDCYGMISRNIRGMLDEAYAPDLSGGGLNGADTYYRAPDGAYNGTGSSGSEKVNVWNWNSASRLQGYFSISDTLWIAGRSYLDVQADEFSFNVGGYSGTFYYSGPQLGWQVISSQNIKVELYDFSSGNYFLNRTEIFPAIGEYDHFTPSFQFIDNSPAQSRMFKGFVITVDNGTKYIFGGQDAVEFTCAYGSSDLTNFYANGWLLKKIIDPYGNEVIFEYKRSYPTVNLSFGQTNFYISSYEPGLLGCQTANAFSDGPVLTNKRSGIMQWPMYLTKISSQSESIEFETSVATCLRYTTTALTLPDEAQTTIKFNFRYLGSNPNDPANTENLKWEKLDFITIKNAKQDVLRKYNFYYDPCSATGPRLTLKNLTELNSGFIANANYTFNYNAVADLPPTYGDYTDHWGYFNNNSVHSTLLPQLLASNLRETNPSYVTKGILTSIKYPTGGSTVFTWEPHDYSGVVSLSKTSIDPLSGYAGGNRISRIQNFSFEGVLLTDKKYYYKKNYTSTSTLSSLSSSGVLNGRPKYHLSIDNRSSYDGQATFDFELVSLHSLSAYSYNAQGSHIGYDEVVEVNSDGSYTKHFFTNYGPDLNGVPHYDHAPGVVGWKADEDPYVPMSSLELERGQSTGVFKYSNKDILLQKNVTSYRNDAGRFNSFVKRIDFNNSYTCNYATGIVFASGRKEYSYVYYPIKTEVTDYDADGKNPIVSTKLLTYNSYNLLSQLDEFDSKGTKQSTINKYTFDFPSDATLTAMASKYILSPIIETSIYTNNPVANLLSQTKVNYSSPFTGIYVPSTIQFKKGAHAIETKQQFNQYDQKGNILETQKPNDIKEVLVWGYNGQYPVAKITGSDYNTVYSFITPSIQTTITNAGLVYSDADMRTALNNIRTGLLNSKALVTTYTYSPIIGMTSQTDPNGRTKFYEYDSYGRLQVIKDQNGNVLKTYDYQYKQ